MWQCRKCYEQHEDSVEICWNCGTSKEGVEDPTFRKADEGDQAGEARVDDADATSKADAESVTVPKSRRRPRRRAPTRTIEQLVFVGFNGYALALDRDTGEIVWSNNEMQSGYVSLLLDSDRLIVSTNGYMYCLDPLTGQIRWHNPLTGYGVAPASLISVRGQSSVGLSQQAADQAARSSND